MRAVTAVRARARAKNGLSGWKSARTSSTGRTGNCARSSADGDGTSGTRIWSSCPRGAKVERMAQERAAIK